MKFKKLAALALSCAMVISGGAFLAACGGAENKKDPGKTNFVEDTRIWFAVGRDTKGTLKDQNWQKDDSKYAFEKDTTKTNENVFTLTLDIYAGNIGVGDSFKFLYKTSADEASVPWERQVGMQHLEGKEGTDADTVLKLNGETVFTTADDNGAYNNIALAKGQEGTYKFTLKTTSNDDANPKIYVEKVKAITVNYDMYVIGDMNNFGADSKLGLTEVVAESKTTWVGKLEVKKTDLYRNAEGALDEDDDGKARGTYAAVCLLNGRDNKTFVPAAGEGVVIKTVKSFNNKDYTCVLLAEGKYDVVFTENVSGTTVGGTVEIKEKAFDMYLIGSFNGWAQGDTDYAMTEQGDVYVATITVTKNEELKTFNKKGLTDSDKYSAGNNVQLTAGTWAVKYNPADNSVVVEQYAYWIVGTFNGANFSIKQDVTPKCVAGATEGTFTCEYEVTVDAKTTDPVYNWLNDSKFALKAVYGTSITGVKDWIGENLMVSELGTYIVTVTVTANGTTSALAKK